jgi:putative FmdB family regulatory protein
MPIYEYRCSRCSEVFEQLVLGRSADPVECPQCGSRKAEQLVSRFAAQTRGGAALDSGCFNASAGICQAGGGPMT